MSVELPEHSLEGVTLPVIEHDFLHVDSMDREKLTKYYEYLQRRVNDPERYMDKGGAGYVFNVNDSMCLKMIEDRQYAENIRAEEEGRTPIQLNLGNTPFLEARIQESLSEFQVADVRSPILVQYLQGSLWHGLAMEKLNAVNLQKCLNGEQELPKTFNKEAFAKKLGDYVDKLHQEKKIAHGDLFARNVMIDNLTGNPIVIDFGRSTYIEKGKADGTEDDWKNYDDIYDALLARFV